MTEVPPSPSTWPASDGYPIHVSTWRPEGLARARVVILHGVQSHAGWYGGLGSRLAAWGFEVVIADRRGSGANPLDRGHTPDFPRLIADIGEWIEDSRGRNPSLATVLCGISWGGKTALLASATYPERVQGLALICPGLHPRVGVPLGERLKIAWAYFTDRKRRFPIPLSDPALFTANPEAQRFIADDPLSLRTATAGLLAASTFIDRAVARCPAKVRQPALLMLAGRDRIVDNAKTRAYFGRIASRERRVIEYPEAHHTLEFEPDPSRYVDDLAGWIGSAVIGGRS